ncbi:hypothetical protein [Fundidesulfovibrio soli]|uniref:hypothetical protein n=1 Tax=Fundidesulfovibrio soli TaxID=2922716 RepID=UPI001FAF8E8D|nr:hypothetical protein [Fundidesulfovibrio soli]
MHCIQLPQVVDFKEALDFSLVFCSTPSAQDYVFDLSLVKQMRPFGMLLTAALIRSFIASKQQETESPVRFHVANFDQSKPAHGYAAHVGFFRSWGAPYGSTPKTEGGNSSYKPIRELSVTNIISISRELKAHPGEIVEAASKEFACFLGVGSNPDIVDTLTYAIREIIRNVFEHSKAESVWLAGQYWPTYQRIEIAILDQGVGITKTLKNNPKIVIIDDENALNLAIRPGVSGKLIGDKQRRHDKDDPWANSGYGLYVTSRLCQNGGKYIIASGGKALILEGQNASFAKCQYNGTAIMMQLNLANVNNLQQCLKDIVKEGRQIARGNDFKGNLTASMITTNLSEWIKPRP